jgi:PAS domain S-box-containing protein
MNLGFGMATSVLALFAALACFSTYRLLDDGRMVAESLEVLAALEGTLASIAQAEASQRDALLARDPASLRPFRVAMKEASQKLSLLAFQTADNPVQTEKIARLLPMVADRFKALEASVEARNASAYGAVSELAGSAPGHQGMEAIRSLIDEMTAVERQRRLDRVARSELSAQVAYITYAALLIVVLGLLWAVFRIIRADLLERARVEEALQQSRERYEVAVLGSRDGIWDWDLTTNQSYYSPRWKGMLGYEDDEIANDHEEFRARLHPDDVERVEATIAAYLASELDDYEQELRLRHKDGTHRWILTRGVALRDEHGKPFRMAGSHTDITARKRAEELLSEQNRRLEAAARSERSAHEALKLTQSRLVQSEKLAGLGQMVAGVAHEINNPLSFVINNATILERDVNELRALLALYEEADELLAAERPALFDRITAYRTEVAMEYTLENLRRLLTRSHDGLKRIQQVVKDLRLFARLDEGDFKEADLNAGIESTVTIIRGNARRSDVQLAVELSPLPLVHCYPAKINQVILNLLSNAVDACESGGVVTVRSRTEDHGATVRIEVTDTGTGIDPAIRERIFDPFFTTKPVGQGTGLGLSISYGIVQEHGGTIEVDSQLGVGTTFLIRLPVVAAETARETVERHAHA